MTEKQATELIKQLTRIANALEKQATPVVFESQLVSNDSDYEEGYRDGLNCAAGRALQRLAGDLQ